MNRAGTTVCALCAGNISDPCFALDQYTVMRCRACGLQFLSPQPDAATLAGIYDTHYFLDSDSPQLRERFLALKRATAALYLNQIVARLGKGTGRLLEVGCGQGDCLLEAQARGFVVSGVEFNPDSVAIANKRLGSAAVKTGTLEDAGFSAASFDVVVMADVLEHVNDPVVTLRLVHALLRPGGLLFLATPSLASWSARLMGSHWMEYKVEHLFYFNPQTIRLALEKADFQQIVVARNTKVLSFDYVCAHFEQFPVKLVSPTLRLLHTVVPRKLGHRPWRVVASGLTAMSVRL